jgi:hypothetical protein
MRMSLKGFGVAEFPPRTDKNEFRKKTETKKAKKANVSLACLLFFRFLNE